MSIRWLKVLPGMALAACISISGCGQGGATSDPSQAPSPQDYEAELMQEYSAEMRGEGTKAPSQPETEAAAEQEEAAPGEETAKEGEN